MDELISPLTRHLLDLFGGPLRDVRFPDADVERLSRTVDEAEAAYEALVRAQLSVDAAREALAEKQRAVGKQTERTVAYARIYAADRPELLASLDSLTTAPRRGRGRPRKDGSAATRRPQDAANTDGEGADIEKRAASHAAE